MNVPRISALFMAILSSAVLVQSANEQKSSVSNVTPKYPEFADAKPQCRHRDG